jgi:hypothetical protein
MKRREKNKEEEKRRANNIAESSDGDGSSRMRFTEADYSPWKMAVVFIMIASSAAIFGFTLASSPSVARALAAALLFASLISIQPLLIKGMGRIFLSVTLYSIALFAPIFFINKTVPFVVLAVAAVISFLLFIWGQVAGRRELDNSLKINFSRLSGAVLARSLTAIAIAGAIVYGWNFRAESLFSDKFLGNVINASVPIVGYYIPNFDPTMNLRDFLEVSARQSLAAGGVLDFNLMPDTLKNQLLNQTIENSRKSLENNFGISIDLDSSFADNFKSAITEKLKDPITSITSDYLSAIMAVIIFFFSRGALWLMSWIAGGLSFLLYQMALVTGFARLSLEPRSKEIVLLK